MHIVEKYFNETEEHMDMQDLQEMVLVKEKYFGKNSNLKKVENLVQEIIDVVKKEEKVDLNKFKQMRKIEEIFAKEFNFYTALIEVTQNAANAYTLLFSNAPRSKKGYRKDIIKTNSGVKFNTKAKVSLYMAIDIHLITYTEMNAEELVAIMLHEIGHQFQYSGAHGDFKRKVEMIRMLVGAILSGPEWVGLLLNANEDEIKGELEAKKDNFMDKDKKMVKVKKKIKEKSEDLSGGFFDSIKGGAKGFIVGLGKFLTNAVIAGLTGFIGFRRLISAILPTNMTGYDNEKFADSFATAYGYGAALSAGMRKLEKYAPNEAMEKLRDNKFLAFTQDIMMFPAMLLVMISDVHPDNMTRIVNQIEQLEKEMENSNVPKEVKAQIKKDLEGAKEELNKLLNELDEETKLKLLNTDSKILQRNWNRILHFIFKKGDWREIFIRKTGKDYEVLDD